MATLRMGAFLSLYEMLPQDSGDPDPTKAIMNEILDLTPAEHRSTIARLLFDLELAIGRQANHAVADAFRLGYETAQDPEQFIFIEDDSC